MKSVILKTDGTRVDNGTPSTSLEVLQAAVGGYIEIVPHFTTFESQRCVAFCNKDGKSQGLHFNDAATTAWQQAQLRLGISIDDILVGDVLIMIGTASELERL
jgi:hypothetical protein